MCNKKGQQLICRLEIISILRQIFTRFLSCDWSIVYMWMIDFVVDLLYILYMHKCLGYVHIYVREKNKLQYKIK